MATAPSEPIPISTSNPNVNIDASGNITPAETQINNGGVVKFNVTFPKDQTVCVITMTASFPNGTQTTEYATMRSSTAAAGTIKIGS
jgi:hypothetical protein